MHPEVDERIAAQLAELGEEPLSEEELRLVVGASAVETASEDVRGVAALFALQDPDPVLDAPLSDLERERAWRRTKAANDGGRSRWGGWGAVAIAVAVAAAVVLFVWTGSPAEKDSPVAAAPSLEEAAAIGEQADLALNVLGVERRKAAQDRRDGARARSYAQAYASKLREEGQG